MTRRTTGRLVGAMFLLAFLCYGVGSALAPSSVGTALVLINSLVVATLGALVFRAFQPVHPRAAWVYLGARGLEAALLAASVVLLTSTLPEAAGSAYQLAMLSLGIGSLPLLAALRRSHWLPGWLAVWGLAGYALLALGAVAELLGIAVGLVLTVPGGLFEIVLAVILLYRGFPERHRAAAATTPGSRRQAALIAGLGLLIMAVLAGLASFAVLDRLVTDDATSTTQSLLENQTAFQLAIVGLALVAILDVVVAWALWVFFDRVNHMIALLAAWCRTAYAVAFGYAILQLVVAAGTLPEAEATSAAIGRFDDLWQLALIIFGVHLLLVGWLAWRSGQVPRLIAVLVALAGVGYLADSVGPLVWSGYAIEVSVATFVGEVALMGWLLVTAVRRPDRQRSGSVPDGPAGALAGAARVSAADG